MKFFIGQKVSGENLEKLRKELDSLYGSLKEKGHFFYDTLQEGGAFQKKSKKEMLDHAFKKIDESDAFLAIVRNEEKSEGMLIEIGYCLATNKRIILLINKEVKNTYLKEVASKVIEFENFEELSDKLNEL